jgi:periplasmic protein TonB
MFDQLPETNPHKNKRKLETFAFAATVQVVLVAAAIMIQMAMPEKLGEFQLLTTLYMAPPPPPPPAPVGKAPEPVRHAEQPTRVQEAPAVVEPQPTPVQEKPEIVAPTAIPQDIARIVESGPPSGTSSGGVPGGVRGGVPGGVNGGLFGGVLGGAGVENVPPPPPTGPVRVGGNVKQPKLVHMEQPAYPAAAKRAHIEGVVIIEATLTADGTVDKTKVISGPPLLTDSALEAVQHWKYEPTYLNGQAVPVILTARITFSLSNSEK